MDLALNNLQRLICHKTNQTKPNLTYIHITLIYHIYNTHTPHASYAHTYISYISKRTYTYQAYTISIPHTLFERTMQHTYQTYHHHHHHVVPPARISLTLSRHFCLSFIASCRSSGLHPVSSHSCCM